MARYVVSARSPLYHEPAFAGRRAAVWYGGREEAPREAATTALAFSNALRTFYSFIYHPTVTTERELAHGSNGRPYFVRRLIFGHDVASIFAPYLFAPLERLVVTLARALRLIQSGQLNFYLSLIGALLIIVLLITFGDLIAVSAATSARVCSRARRVFFGAANPAV